MRTFVFLWIALAFFVLRRAGAPGFHLQPEWKQRRLSQGARVAAGRALSLYDVANDQQAACPGPTIHGMPKAGQWRKSVANAANRDLYFRDISKRWKREAVSSAQERLIIRSPYLTSRVAESVACKCAGGADIYTLFDADCFASGASSLATIRKLLVAGHRLFRLDGLHAKIVLSPGQFASIGSQNLTRGGRLRKEASVVLDHHHSVEHVRAKVRKWTNTASAIDVAMVDDMESAVGHLRTEYRKLARAARQAQTRFLQRAKEREESAQKAEAQRRLRTRRLRRLQAVLRALPRSADAVPCRVTEQHPTDWIWGGTSYCSLVKGPGHALTQWATDDGHVVLERANRHLIMRVDSGRLGWARVMDTRITFVNRDLHLDETFKIVGVSCRLRLSANWNTQGVDSHNLSMQIVNDASDCLCEADFWFSLDGLKLIRVQPPFETSADSADCDAVVQWVLGEPPEIATDWVPLILDPFRYKRKCSGIHANGFFGSAGSRHQISLAQVQGKNILICSSPQDSTG